MGKLKISNFHLLDEYDELYGGTEKIKKNDNKQKNIYEENLQQSQGMPSGWREGDSHIGRQKKARNKNL
jgi:hypothetical protein|tara:strand:- start:220 stop:426 length:207 start_codon:yes stop_codon:yes gene_type:complete